MNPNPDLKQARNSIPRKWMSIQQKITWACENSGRLIIVHETCRDFVCFFGGGGVEHLESYNTTYIVALLADFLSSAVFVLRRSYSRQIQRWGITTLVCAMCITPYALK